MERVHSGMKESPWRHLGGRFLLTAAVAWMTAWGATAQETSPVPEPAPAPAAQGDQPAAPAETQAAPAADAAQGDQPAEKVQPVEGQKSPETQDATEETPVPGEDSAKSNRWIRGSFEAGTDMVFDDDDSDINLDQTLRLQIDPPQYPNLHFRGALWMDEDLDSDPYYRNVVRDYNDTTHSGVRANLLYLYAQIDDLWGDSVLRIGRQRIEESPLYNRVDGLYFKQRLSQFEWYVFGGARGSIYFDTHDDEVLGGGVAWQATPTTRLALDAYYGDEERGRDNEVHVSPIYKFWDLEFPRRVHSEVNDNYVSLSLWQWFSPNVNLFGRFGVQNGDADDLVIDVTGVVPQWGDLSYEAAYHRQFEENTDQVNDITAFYRILGDLEPYDNFLLALHKPLNKIYTLSFEGEWNKSHAGDDEQQANRDYQRYALILSGDEIVPTIDASIGLEYWDVDEGEGTWAVTGEVSKTWDRVVLTLGADYERYEDRLVRYNPAFEAADWARMMFVPGGYARFNPVAYVFDRYGVETHLDIYSFYGKLKYQLAENQDVSLRVTYEEDDAPESPYWRVQAAYTINF